MMALTETTRAGRRGTVVIPARLRRAFGIEEGTLLVAEERPDGIMIRPAVAVPIRHYTKEEKASFLLSTAVDAEDYDRASQAVRELGLDPEAVPHRRPLEQ